MKYLIVILLGISSMAKADYIVPPNNPQNPGPGVQIYTNEGRFDVDPDRGTTFRPDLPRPDDLLDSDNQK